MVEHINGIVAPHGHESAPDTTNSQHLNNEVELKLLCDLATINQIAVHPAVIRCAVADWQTAELRTSYFDTPDLALHGLGLTCRVRVEGDCFHMTVKSQSTASEMAFSRSEWSVVVGAELPDYVALEKILPREVFSQIKAFTLSKLFVTDVVRRTMRLQMPGGLIELAVDEGQLVAGGERQAISEIELELLGGDRNAIYQLADEISSDLAMRPSQLSKSERGFDLIRRKSATLPDSPRLDLGRHAKLEDLLGPTMQAWLQYLVASQDAVGGGDMEAVHHCRVALRHLLSLFSLMEVIAPWSKTSVMTRDARWLIGELNDARGLDVMLSETIPAVARGCPAEDFKEGASSTERRRAAAYERAHAAIASQRTGHFEIALAHWICQRAWRREASPEGVKWLGNRARDFAKHAAGKDLARVLKRGPKFKRLDARGIHRVRLAAKRLRYTMECFSPVFRDNGSWSHFEGILKEFLDLLGAYNDALCACDQISIDLRDPSADERKIADGVVIGWQRRNAVALRETIIQAWHRLKKTDFPD